MINLIIAVISVNFIRKNVNTEKTLPQWDSLLHKIPYVAIFLFLFDIYISEQYWFILSLLWLALLGFVLYILWILKDNRIAKVLLWAGVPYLGVSLFILLVRLVLPNVFEEYHSFFEMLKIGSLLWIAAFGFGASNQQKALAKEEAKNREILKQKESLENLVSQRTAEITEQKEELEKALEELKETQTQLIQREKMASLGELTAGIAHEIQNPLNFVNNFAELSVDLIKDLKEEMGKSPLTPEGGVIISDKAYFDELFNDLSQNQEKINHHGKRASNIIKGMLEHSRSSTGEWALTNINELCDEYIRLSYHGMRAKDKSFNADFKMNFDETVGTVNVIPQDLGRVLLNLFNNAFYAVQKKKKALGSDTLYTPSVSVKTKRIVKTHDDDDDLIEITVKDNGDGIPENIQKKIFQPFFTTKPTGEGTGLGLSLSFDIITKGHAGTLEVKSQENLGTEFIIILPVS